jgi:hypothetical protein
VNLLPVEFELLIQVETVDREGVKFAGIETSPRPAKLFGDGKSRFE